MNYEIKQVLRRRSADCDAVLCAAHPSESGLPMQRSLMSINQGAHSNQDTQLENFAAELTRAVYPLALRHGTRGSWINVELGLWRALTATVKKWARIWPRARSLIEFKVWRQSFLVDLVEGAFHIALKNGIEGSLLEVELGLYRALRLVIRRRCRA